MRRLILAFVVLSVMTVTVVAGLPATEVGPTSSASAQVPGQTTYCGPWFEAWYVSQSSWWYWWWYRWCYNPSIQGGWYKDWAGWQWDGYAGAGNSPGFKFATGPF